MPPDVATAVAAGCAGWLTWLALRWLGVGRTRRRAARLARDIERGLPFVFDMMVLCVEAGMSVQGRCNWPRAAVRRACCVTRWTARWSRCAPACRKRSRSGCWPGAAAAPGGPLAVAMAQAEALGASLGPVLRTLAAHGRDDRRIRAEQMALQAPVKMLLPLIGCIFPAPSSCWPFLSWCSCRGACLDTPGAADGTAPAAAGGWLVGGCGAGVAQAAGPEGGHPAHAVFRGAYLRHAPSHRRGLRIALGARLNCAGAGAAARGAAPAVAVVELRGGVVDAEHGGIGRIEAAVQHAARRDIEGHLQRAPRTAATGRWSRACRRTGR